MNGWKTVASLLEEKDGDFGCFAGWNGGPQLCTCIDALYEDFLLFVLLSFAFIWSWYIRPSPNCFDEHEPMRKQRSVFTVFISTYTFVAYTHLCLTHLLFILPKYRLLTTKFCAILTAKVKCRFYTKYWASSFGVLCAV